MDRGIFEDEHTWFRESAARFVAHELMPARSRIRSKRSIGRELWHKAGEAGFLGIGVPAEWGGSGVTDFRFNVVFGEELSVAGAAYASCFTLHTDVVAPYLVQLATPAQRDRWLPGFCSGELVSALAMTEPGAGSDLAALRTTARKDGRGWILNGAKTFITNGRSADLVIVAARTGQAARGHEISLFILEAADAGFSRGRKLEKIGQHESDTAELFLEDVRIGADRLLGEAHQGFAHMMQRLPQERLSVAVVNVAHAAEALRQTLAYVNLRQAFGKPIGTFQHNRFVLAELSTAVDVARAYVDRCVRLHVAGQLSPVDAAKAKWWSSDMQNQVLDACVQLFGGYGYMEEYDVARAWADARVSRIWAGSNEIMKEVIGRAMGLDDRERRPR